MRRALLFLLLLAAVTAASFWHRDRFLRPDAPTPPPFPSAPPEDRIVLRVGGGGPVPTPPPPPRGRPSRSPLEPAPPPAASSPPRHVVRSGETLSEIVQASYGTSRPALLRSVARHNGLRDPDRIVVGTVLTLPPELLDTP